jgi:hypothetical protein
LKRPAPPSGDFDADYDYNYEGSSPRKRPSGTDGTRNGRKQVVQYDLVTGVVLKVYHSGSEAARALSISQSNVSQCCRGEGVCGAVMCYAVV